MLFFSLVFFKLSVCKSQESAGLTLEVLHELLDILSFLFRHIGAQGEYFFRISFGIKDPFAFFPHDSAHILILGRKRENLYHISLMTHFLVIHTSLLRRCQQRTFCGITDEGPFAVLPGNISITVDAVISEQYFILNFLRPNQLTISVNLLHRHLIFRQCSRLVGADDIHAADGLAGDHLFDQRIFLRHLDDVKCQRNRHDGRQTFRHRRHDQDYTGDKGIRHRAPVQLLGHDKADDFNGKYNGRRSNAQNSDLLSQSVQFFLQGRGGLFNRGKLLSDFSKFRIITYTGDQQSAVSGRYKAAGVKHTASLRHGSLFLTDKIRILFHRDAFSRQRRLIHVQLITLQQSSVCHDLISGLHQNDIADDDFSLGYLRGLSVSDHLDQCILVDTI